MESPFATRPVAPSLRPQRVERTTADRRRKGRSFEETLGDEAHEEHDGAPEQPTPAPKKPQAPKGGAAAEEGHLLDLEA